MGVLWVLRVGLGRLPALEGQELLSAYLQSVDHDSGHSFHQFIAKFMIPFRGDEEVGSVERDGGTGLKRPGLKGPRERRE